MFDNTIKDAISNPKVGNNTVLKIQYKIPYIIKYINLFVIYS